MHAVVALALPTVEAFDLAVPAQVFADPGLPRRYDFTVKYRTMRRSRSTGCRGDSVMVLALSLIPEDCPWLDIDRW
jgi:hypothetical protein